MTDEQRDNGTWYLRAFSSLLIICGLFGVATGAVVMYQAFAESAPAEIALPLGALTLGMAEAAANGITLAAGIVGHIACRDGRRMGTLYTLALAGIVATVMGLGLCYATGAGMPTSLLFNGLLVVICAVIANNLRKSLN